jgi:putative endopeptidase
VSEEIEKRIESDLEKLMKECIELSIHHPRTLTYMESVQGMLGSFATSVLKADSTLENLNTVQQVLQGIQGLQTQAEVATVMGEFVRYKIGNLFSIYAQYENRKGTEFTYTIGVGSLGLDASYYHSKSLRRAHNFKGYKHFIDRLAHKFHMPQLPCVVKLERILAGVILQTDKDTIEKEYKGSELETQFAYIPFSILFETMGLHTWRSRIFFVESTRWLHTLNKLFHHLGLDYWRLILSHEFLLYSLPWLPPEYSNLSFQFYRKQLRGQQKKLSREKQAIYVLQQYATPFFSRLYVDRIVDKSIKPKVEAMIEHFLKVGEKRLATVDWLEPKTRKAAQEKVSKMRFLVAFPDSFEQLSLPTLSKTNLLSNLLAMGEWQTKHEIQKLGQPMSQRKDWDDAVFVVNAYYYGQANEMVIPSGILQEPFYGADRSVAWNYGGLGSILCHELTHAFDKEGKEYDPKGQQKRWWTRNDNRNYNKQTKALIELYTKQKIHGFPVSGKRTLSENIADIGGMSIALQALKETLDSQKLTEQERQQAYKDFFTSYAISWRQKDKKQKRIQQLISDRHAPASVRVNLVVSQFQEWYDAFDIQPKDALYLPPEKRIHIF